jgi:cell division septation protein DedD
MTGPFCRLNSLLLLVFLLLTLPAFAQVSVIPAADIRVGPEIVIEARVAGVPAADFARLGIMYPESDADSDSPLGFAVVLPENEARSLILDPRTTSVHSLRLRGTPGNTLRFRVDTRVLTNENSFAEVLPYFEVGMIFEVTPQMFPNRNVALSSSSVVQVRRGPSPGGGLAPLVFETQPIKHDIQIPEGKTILLGGFLTASNSSNLPRIPVVAGNPILGYVGTKSPRRAEETEIVLLLTPRVNGVVDAVVPPVSVVPPVTEAVKEPEMKVEQLAAAVLPSTGNATPKPELSTPAPVVVPSPTAPTASVARVAAAPAPVSRTAAPAAPPPTASKSESRFFTVQVGAFASNENAELLVTELKRKFEGVFVDQAPVGRTPYRVRVGRLSTMAAAKQVQSRLMAQGFESFVVTPEMP